MIKECIADKKRRDDACASSLRFLLPDSLITIESFCLFRRKNRFGFIKENNLFQKLFFLFVCFFQIFVFLSYLNINYKRK